MTEEKIVWDIDLTCGTAQKFLELPDSVVAINLKTNAQRLLTKVSIQSSRQLTLYLDMTDHSDVVYGYATFRTTEPTTAVKATDGQCLPPELEYPIPAGPKLMEAVEVMYPHAETRDWSHPSYILWRRAEELIYLAGNSKC